LEDANSLCPEPTHKRPEDLVHSLEIGDHDIIANVVRRIREPATQRRANKKSLSSINTMVLYLPRGEAAAHHGAIGVEHNLPKVSSQVRMNWHTNTF
jgi:hypothetical protein